MQVQSTPTGPAVAVLLQPRTEVYDVKKYTCQAGDTWEKLSKAHYGEETAAAALREFNRNHPRADDRVRADGSMPPGATVYIPQLRVLQRHGLDLGPTPTIQAPGAGSPKP